MYAIAIPWKTHISEFICDKLPEIEISWHWNFTLNNNDDNNNNNNNNNNKTGSSLPSFYRPFVTYVDITKAIDHKVLLIQSKATPANLAVLYTYEN